MIIQRDTSGQIRRTKNGRYYFRIRFEDGTVVQARERDWWTATAFRALDRLQKRKPAGLLNLDDLTWWRYKGKAYLTEGHPRPTEVANFLELRKVLTDFTREAFFSKDAAFKMKTIGKRTPPGVPLAEIVSAPSGESQTRPKHAEARPKPPRRQYIPDRVKIFVWKRDDGRCVTCGSPERLEFDHIIPVSKGGSNTARNLQLLCELCNRKKGTAIA